MNNLDVNSYDLNNDNDYHSLFESQQEEYKSLGEQSEQHEEGY